MSTDIVINATIANTLIGPVPLALFQFALDADETTVDTVTLPRVPPVPSEPLSGLTFDFFVSKPAPETCQVGTETVPKVCYLKYDLDGQLATVIWLG